MFGLQYRARMVGEIPKVIDSTLFAGEASKLEGTISPQRFTRLDGLYRCNQPARVSFFSRNQQHGAKEIVGGFEVELTATCQRCLEIMSFQLGGEFIIRIAEQDDSFSDADYFVAPDAEIDPVALVEDEIILACPMIPSHDTPSCHQLSSSDKPEDVRTQRPFAALGDLMKNAGKPTDT